MNVCVFAGARGGEELLPAARWIGQELAKAWHDLYYGASRKGIMGALCDGYKSWWDTNGLEPGCYGKVHGVLPTHIHRLNHWDTDVDNIVTTDMHSRKQVFWDRCDAFLCLPGAYGTMDELFGILTLTKLGIERERPIVVFNQNGFYDGLILLMSSMVSNGTMDGRKQNLVKFVWHKEEVMDALFPVAG